MTLLLLLLACTPSTDDGKKRRTATGPPGGVAVGTPAGTPGGTPTDSGTTTWATTFDCTNRPQAPFTTQQFNIQTEEDFSFDTVGRLVYQQGNSILGASTTGDVGVLTTGAPGDPAGLDVVSEHDLLIAGPDTGTLRMLDLDLGTGVTLMSNLSQPNSVLGGNDGMYYVAELHQGRVRWYDPASGTDGPVVGGLQAANGIVLSRDEQLMYIGGSDTITVVERDAFGEWDPNTQAVFYQEPGTIIYTMEVDFCGWLYVVGYNTGTVKRVSPDGSEVEPVAQLGGGWSWGGMNFGTDAGGWNRDWLYVTDRSKVVGIDVGIPGARGPNILAP